MKFALFKMILYLAICLVVVVATLNYSGPLIDGMWERHYVRLGALYAQSIVPLCKDMASRNADEAMRIGQAAGMRVAQYTEIPATAHHLTVPGLGHTLLLWPSNDSWRLAMNFAQQGPDGVWQVITLLGPEGARLETGWNQLAMVRNALLSLAVPQDLVQKQQMEQALQQQWGVPITLHKTLPPREEHRCIPFLGQSGSLGWMIPDPDGTWPLWAPLGQGWARISDPELSLPVTGFLVASILVVGAALLLVAFFPVYRMQSRIARLAYALRDIAKGNFQARCSESGSGELKQVARDINNMAHQLERSMAQQKAWLYTLAHELRSPLARARMRLLAFGNESPMLEKTDEDLAQISGFVDEITEQLRRNGAAILRTQCCDLGLLAQSIGRTIPNLEMECALEAAPAVVLPQLIERVFRQLFDNARHYGTKNLRIRAGSSSDAAGVRWSYVEIYDDAGGLTAAQYADLGLPQQQYHGSGLGLALCVQSLRGAGGNLEAHPIAGGTCWRCTLPYATAQN